MNNKLTLAQAKEITEEFNKQHNFKNQMDIFMENKEYLHLCISSDSYFITFKDAVLDDIDHSILIEDDYFFNDFHEIWDIMSPKGILKILSYFGVSGEETL